MKPKPHYDVVKPRPHYEPPHGAATHPVLEEKHVMDYVRVVYKRRWIAIPVFLFVFVVGTVNALRQIPIYQAHVQLLIESDTPKVARLDQMFQSENAWDDEFRQTQFRILQSRTLAKRTIDGMKLWDEPTLGRGPAPKPAISFTALAWSALYSAIDLAKSPFTGNEPTPAPERPMPTEEIARKAETAKQSSRIDEFLGSVSILPVRNSRIVEVRYSSTDPEFASDAANALVKTYIQQNMESKFTTSKDAADFLSEKLGEQRKALEASEAALQAYKEKNGTVSVADSASNIVVQRLSDLNTALTKAKTDRINKEALYNQLKSAEGSGALETYPAVITNEYIQKVKADLSELQKQQAQLAQRYDVRHPEMIKMRGAIESADAKLKGELAKVVESVKNEYQAALSQERSLQEALNSQKTEALSYNRKGIEYGVLTREVESNKQIYESLMQRTKETGISSDLRASNVRVVDPAEVPRSPISPNIQRDVMVSMATSLALAIGLAFGVERLDNRIRTPQEMKAHVGIPFLGMVPATAKHKGSPNPLVTNGASPNFIEAIKTVRTNVLFSTAEDGLKTLVVTSAGPSEGKSIVAANLALSLAQAGQRVLLIDADMRRPRVHEIFDVAQEPGLSNVLTANAKITETIHKSGTPGLWLLSSGHIPPNPAELLGSRRFLDLIGSLEEHFDWAIVDTPPVLAVADSTIAANEASGVLFVVGADKTTRHAARAALEQLDAAKGHLIGAVLNNAAITKHPYYYQGYYRKEYAKYYVSSAN
jgi:polysaccharide biosynthesis transport protein